MNGKWVEKQVKQGQILQNFEVIEKPGLLIVIKVEVEVRFCSLLIQHWTLSLLKNKHADKNIDCESEDRVSVIQKT